MIIRLYLDMFCLNIGWLWKYFSIHWLNITSYLTDFPSETFNGEEHPSLGHGVGNGSGNAKKISNSWWEHGGD